MAFKNISVLCLLLSLLCNEASTANPCEPDCAARADFDKVVDPRDCRRFYVCIGEEPQPNSIPCGLGLSFNGTAQSCVVDFPRCNSVCGPDGGSGECRLTCSNIGDTINDPFNCGIYYECAVGGLLTKKCPDNTYFDSSMAPGGPCVADESVCCVPGCTPHCQAANSVIPDPLDCSYYYLCLDVGKPQEEYRMPCKAGEYFDLPLGECSSNGKCQVLCPSSTSAPQPSSGPPVTTSTSSDCANSFQCKNTGLFPKCNSCHSQYFKCDEVGKPAVEESCEEGFLFNPVLSFPHCILSSVCPYLPFLK